MQFKKSVVIVSALIVLNGLTITLAVVPSGDTSPPFALKSSFLSIGSVGKDVVTLQSFLEEGGYLVMPKGVQKGKFGNFTRDALKKFQKDNGIIATGILGPKTKAIVINNSSNKKVDVSVLKYESSTSLKSEGGEIKATSSPQITIKVTVPIPPNEVGTSSKESVNMLTSPQDMTGVCDDKQEGDFCIYSDGRQTTSGNCKELKELLVCVSK